MSKLLIVTRNSISLWSIMKSHQCLLMPLLAISNKRVQKDKIRHQQTLSVTSHVVFFLLVCNMQWQGVRAVSCDDGCANGGRLLMPSNVFGVCRCKCPDSYAGPKCQFVTKKRDLPTLLFSLSLAKPYDQAVDSALKDEEYNNQVKGANKHYQHLSLDQEEYLRVPFGNFWFNYY